MLTLVYLFRCHCKEIPNTYTAFWTGSDGRFCTGDASRKVVFPAPVKSYDVRAPYPALVKAHSALAKLIERSLDSASG
ncbi:hypothetical protein CPC08DRAFT_710335 [Agrocybe pediades]|nr:hypothetical protein CPC08DRAFT_710335 [Agrocybe pediades]